ncbi:hypothetical protein ILT44_12425 [Microvirga sp. BT689]|uniref:hypothetical protein n=1 Tax=Microvirga arvi TaxID=2778731 RepID=UPI001951B508|nr:hypothetical protein [Microvirga arvi]MBM6580991.1 hypothetical protein [Microvirga arvi]
MDRSSAGKANNIRGNQSIHFSLTAGFMEGTETILFFAAIILLPQYFPILAYAFAGLTLMSALAWVTLAWHAFRDKLEESD